MAMFWYLGRILATYSDYILSVFHDDQPVLYTVWYGISVLYNYYIRRQESDCDGGAGEKKERKTKAEVVG